MYLEAENKKLREFVEYVANEDNFKIVHFYSMSRYQHDDICDRAQKCLEELEAGGE